MDPIRPTVQATGVEALLSDGSVVAVRPLARTTGTACSRCTGPHRNATGA